MLRPLLWEVDVKPSRPEAPWADGDTALGRRVVSRGEPSCSGPLTVVVNLPVLDTVQAESIGLFLWSDVRPLAGVAGTIDWRVCGGLSRLLEEAVFSAAEGEVLLHPVGGRFGLRRLFLFGLGSVAETDPAALRRACRKAHDALQRAGAGQIVLGAPLAPRYPAAESDFLLAVADELPGQVHAVLVSQGSS
jgi:hypothetical protein